MHVSESTRQFSFKIKSKNIFFLKRNLPHKKSCTNNGSHTEKHKTAGDKKKLLKIAKINLNPVQ